MAQHGRVAKAGNTATAHNRRTPNVWSNHTCPTKAAPPHGTPCEGSQPQRPAENAARHGGPTLADATSGPPTGMIDHGTAESTQPSLDLSPHG